LRRGIRSGTVREAADLVHAHDARAHTLAVIAGRKPLIVSRRVAFPIKHSFLSRRKYEKASMYIAVSRFVAGCLHQAGIRDERIRVVYDGVPVPDRETTREPGRVVALREKSPNVAGIHFITDLWQDLSTASVFVYASEMEGLGSAVLAAMAAGVPVVASRIGGIPEIVEHGRTGLLVDNSDFETPVRQLLADPDCAAQMGRAGRELVKQKFTVEHMVEQTKRVYQEVLGA
jgi:hypothetical protein